MKYKMTIGWCVLALAGGLVWAAAAIQAKTADEKAAEEITVKESEQSEPGPAGEPMQSDGESDWFAGAGVQLFLCGRSSVETWGISEAADVSGNELPAEAESPEREEESEYADLAIADVTNYVNVRTEPDTSGDIVGKIYDGAVAQILSVVAGEDGEWFQVVSGNVEGYIKSEFFLYGDAAAAVIEDYVTRYATVAVDRLNVRREPDIESSRIGYIDSGEDRGRSGRLAESAVYAGSPGLCGCRVCDCIGRIYLRQNTGRGSERAGGKESPESPAGSD